MIYAAEKYENLRYAPLLGNRVVTVNRVRGTKKYVVIVEPSMGCSGEPSVVEFSGQNAWTRALAEFHLYVEGSR